MKPTLRAILVESHIPAVTISLLLLWSLQWIYQALLDPLLRAAGYVFNAVAILDIPYSSPGLSFVDQVRIEASAAFLSYALIHLTAAWLLARWAYAMGPFRILNAYWVRWRRGDA